MNPGSWCVKAVVVLSPDMRGKQVVERRDGTPPRNIAGDLQPFRMLVEHGIDDVDEGFVTGKETMAPGEEIAFEPALAHVFAQDFHHAAVRRKVLIGLKLRFHKGFIGGFKQGIETVRSGLVGTKDAEVLGVGVETHHVAQQLAEYTRRIRRIRFPVW